MSELGKEIYRTYDAEGPIVVYQDGDRRILAFGNEVEQSCVSLQDPSQLLHAYTQAMMLSLLLVSTLTRVLVLGLGGGGLVRALRRHCPDCRIEAVESREQVLDIAREFFFLPEDQITSVVIADAAEYVAAGVQPNDLVLADLYLAQGMDARQTQREFLGDCRAGLSPGGLLVANLWHGDYRDTREAGHALSEVFDSQVLHLPVHGGNDIAFAFVDRIPVLRRKVFFEAAQALGLKLGIPLQKPARNLWGHNAGAFGE